MGDYIGFWGEPIQGYTTNFVQGLGGEQHKKRPKTIADAQV